MDFIQFHKIDKEGRIKIKVNGYAISRSRYIWECYYGEIPEGMFIHHINEVTYDDRIENLRLVTRKEHGFFHRMLNKKKKKNYSMSEITPYKHPASKLT